MTVIDFIYWPRRHNSGPGRHLQRFSKIINRGSHRLTSHQGTWTGCLVWWFNNYFWFLIWIFNWFWIISYLTLILISVFLRQVSIKGHGASHWFVVFCTAVMRRSCDDLHFLKIFQKYSLKSFTNLAITTK